MSNIFTFSTVHIYHPGPLCIRGQSSFTSVTTDVLGVKIAAYALLRHCERSKHT